MEDMIAKVQSDQKLIVHVGLGKTGTTFLQSLVFPALQDHGIVAFNPGATQTTLNAFADHADYSRESDAFDFRQLRDKVILLSDERLIGWNPRYWVRRCNKLATLFGPAATIIVTLRDPESYLRSMYQQQIHQGNVISPNEFFLPIDEFEKYRNITRTHLNEICSVDEMNYQDLISRLSAIFDNVVVIPYPELMNLNFLKSVLDISDAVHQEILETARAAPRKNLSYSRAAMKMTIWREQILNHLGLKTLGSHDRFRRLMRSRNASPRVPLKSYLRLIFTWRGLMQESLNKILPYRPYRMPHEVYRGSQFQANSEYFRNLEKVKIMEYRKSDG